MPIPNHSGQTSEWRFRKAPKANYDLKNRLFTWETELLLFIGGYQNLNFNNQVMFVQDWQEFLAFKFQVSWGNNEDWTRNFWSSGRRIMDCWRFGNSPLRTSYSSSVEWRAERFNQLWTYGAKSNSLCKNELWNINYLYVKGLRSNIDVWQRWRKKRTFDFLQDLSFSSRGKVWTLNCFPKNTF